MTFSCTSSKPFALTRQSLPSGCSGRACKVSDKAGSAEQSDFLSMISWVCHGRHQADGRTTLTARPGPSKGMLPLLKNVFAELPQQFLPSCQSQQHW